MIIIITGASHTGKTVLAQRMLASRVFRKAREIFAGSVTTVEIDSKHLPSDETMIDVCKRTKEFFKNA